MRWSGGSASARARVKRRLIGSVVAAALLCGAQVSHAQSDGEGAWETTAPMAVARAGHTATLLDGPACKTSPRPGYCGEVLVAGGTVDNPADPYSPPHTRSAELYDAKTGAWTATGQLNVGRSAHTATLLADGKVLVIGGRTDDFSDTTSAELYDPATGVWSSCSSAGTPSASCPGATTGVDGRYDHTATLLKSGKVLVVGGPSAFTSADEGVSNPKAELYDPATGRFTPTGELMQARYQHSATLLPNGRVLVTGGTFPPGARAPDPPAPGRGPETSETKISSELYDPASGTWSSCSLFKPPAGPKPTTADCPGDLGQSRAAHSATLLSDGRVLAAGGGANEEDRKTAELYDPATGAWSLTKLLNQRRSGHGAVLLPSGKVLAAAGQGPQFFSGLGSTELYDPATPGTRWNLAPFMQDPRGSDFQESRSVQAVLLSSDAGTFAADPQVCGTNCGRVLVVGGLDESLDARLASAELYTPPPVASGVSPSSGPTAGGTSVQITGMGLNQRIGSVRFGALPASSFTADAYGQLTAVAPPHAAGPVDVTVTSGSGESKLADAFTYAADAISPPGVGPGADSTRPVITGLRLSPARFRGGSRLPRLASAARVGTRIRFSLSEPATVELAFAARHTGRRVGRRCRRASRRLRHRPRCTRSVAVATRVTIKGARAGSNSVRFQGRLSRRRTLRAGRYRLAVTATDAAGNRSAPKHATLTINRRPRRG